MAPPADDSLKNRGRGPRAFLVSLPIPLVYTDERVGVCLPHATEKSSCLQCIDEDFSVLLIEEHRSNEN